MDLGMTVEILTQLGLGALVTFLAILLWSYTRDSAWMLIIIGIILEFGEVMYTTFELFGIVRPGLLVIRGVAVGKVVLLVLPYIAFAAGFLIMILRSRVRVQTLSESRERDEAGGRRRRRKALTEGVESKASESKEASAPKGSAPASVEAPGGGEESPGTPEGTAAAAVDEEAETRDAAAERAAKAEALEEVEELEEVDQDEPT